MCVFLVSSVSYTIYQHPGQRIAPTSRQKSNCHRLVVALPSTNPHRMSEHLLPVAPVFCTELLPLVTTAISSSIDSSPYALRTAGVLSSLLSFWCFESIGVSTSSSTEALSGRHLLATSTSLGCILCCCRLLIVLPNVCQPWNNNTKNEVMNSFCIKRC